MKLLWCLPLLSCCLGGCLFDGGSSTLAAGAVQAAALCSSAAESGCPACSTPDGGLCRGDWYSDSLRCNSDAQCDASNACQSGYCVLQDADGDGIDDNFEREVAELNFPALYLAADESCGSPHGIIYRVRRHPLNSRRLAITYIVLYSQDCGELNGHPGDAESFAITVDLDAQPGAPATVGVEAWAHAGTACGSTSSCQTAAATGACAAPAGANASNELVLYSSRNKHATYLSMDTCSDNCFDSCSAGVRVTGPFVNVGEPDHPMVRDLTTSGFVQSAAGWDQQLLHADPWGTAEFAGGGRLDKPLTDLVAPPGS